MKLHECTIAANILFISAILLTLIGLALIFSASGCEWSIRCTKHCVATILGVIIAWQIINANNGEAYRCAPYVYCGCVILLLFSYVLGHTSMGAQRWLNFGVFNVQPSELMKIGVIMQLARFFHYTHISNIAKLKQLFVPICVVALPCFITLKQPNFGTAIIICGIGVMMFFIAGVKIRFFLCSIIVIGLIFPTIWNHMHDYQKKRVMIFLRPEDDMLGGGYNIMQSQIAIGSGGMHGKSFASGTQGRLNFLPEQQTDFIFSVLAEEFGFIGVIVVLTIYMIAIASCYVISAKIRSHYYRMIVIGVAIMIFLHMAVNIAMISGLMPVVGIPLLFLSYGSSSLVATFCGIGLVINADKMRYDSLSNCSSHTML